MCEFCLKHGEGRKWYLDVRNYSADLVRNSKRFRDVFQGLALESMPHSRAMTWLRNVLRVPVLGRPVSWMVTRRMKRDHFGQVLTLEDVRRVFELVDAIYSFPCVCRRYLVGGDDERYCFGLGTYLHEVLDTMPGAAEPGPTLTVEEAYARAKAFDEKGLVHTIWTADTPFIVGICSCRPGECLGLDLNNRLRTQSMFRGEHLFSIPDDACVGCRKCMETCYFDAIVYDETTRKCSIRAEACYGCGLCRAACPVDAPTLQSRPGVHAPHTHQHQAG